MSILDSLFSSLRRPKNTPPLRDQPTILPDSETEPPQQTILKTLVIVYEPTMDSTGTKLSKYMRWNKVDGFHYDPQTYLDVLRGIRPPYMPQEANYYEIIDRFNILERVAKNEIDELWVFNFPHAGFYESIMAGPAAFWCNAPPLKNTEASMRRFVIMGFSCERGVGEMLENLGHRAESIMEKTFEKLSGEDNLWKRFTRYDKISPGNAALGNVHFAPNSDRDYDWNNPSTVISECDDWLYNFPNFKGQRRKVTASDWGNGDIRKHHVWWLNHFPKTAGRKNGIHNNWWQYMMNPNHVDVQ